jgi:hypothetical protein
VLVRVDNGEGQAHRAVCAAVIAIAPSVARVCAWAWPARLAARSMQCQCTF